MQNYKGSTLTRINIFLTVFFAVLSLIVQPTEAQSEDYIIVYKGHSQKRNMLKQPTFPVAHDFNIIPAVTAHLDANQVKELRADTNAYSSSDITALASSQTIPYGITMVNAPLVWPRAAGAGVRVAVMDTGISMYHPDRGNVVASVSFVTGEAVEDFHGHGTHTSGTIAAADNDIGVVGVAPGADLLIAKVLDNTGSGQDSWLISGIEWAVNNNAKVISMSLGSSSYSSALDTACSNAYNAGVVLVAAAGNDGTNTPSYPAALSSVISVAAVDQSKNKASFSNYGPTIDLAAPGVSVYSTVPAGIDPSATADAIWSSTSHTAYPVIGTAGGTVSGQICDCGLADGSSQANTCPDSVAGNIAFIRRGTITFAAKAAHAQSKGAFGVIIANNVAGDFSTFTLNGISPLIVLAISQSDGDALHSLIPSGITGTVSINGISYDYYSGTSMACPHVAGVAALLFSAAHYNITPAEVSNILFDSAQDLGTAGRDDYFGYGLVNAYAALKLEKINILQAFADDWLLTCSSPGWCSGMDTNHSGRVDFKDFATLTQNW
jgi:serine protease